MRAPQGLLSDVVRFSWVDGPGNRFVVFMQGCNLDCVACHNPHTIPAASRKARLVTAAELVEEVRPHAAYLSGVTVSGGEATLQAPFVRAFFRALAEDPELHGLTRFLDTNGNATAAVWRSLLPVTDGVMIDLKALDPRVHRTLTGAGNTQVLRSIERVAARGRLYEVRLLLVPSVNDDPATLRATVGWLRAVDPDLRITVIGFRHHGVRAAGRHWPEAGESRLARYREELSALGVRDLEVV